MTQNHIEDIQAITFSDKNRRRSKSSADVRYISLKPLARKERRRQQRLICQVLINFHKYSQTRILQDRQYCSI